MKRKAVIQSKIDFLWEEYTDSVTKVAEMSWEEGSDQKLINVVLMKGLFAYQKLSALEWVLNNGSVGEI